MFRKKLPPEPTETSPFVRTYNVDVLLRKLSDPKDPSFLKEPIRYDEWRCEYCNHLNTIKMLECHICGAPKQ